MIDTPCVNNINNVSQKIVSSENTGRVVVNGVVDGWSMPSTFAQQTVENSWIYSRSSFITNIRVEWLKYEQKMRSNKGVSGTKIIASREMKMDSSLRKTDSSLLLWYPTVFHQLMGQVTT